MKPIIECIRDYVMQFPELKDGEFTVDFLGNEAAAYTVEAVPCNPVWKRYTDGNCQRQFLFLFASREFYSADIQQNIGNLSFYENFEKWIFENNRMGVLPDLDGREPISIKTLTSGYVFDAQSTTARYQIQLRLIYEEE